MGNNIEVTVERFDQGYMLRANSDHEKRYNTLFPKDIQELKSIVQDYGVMPEMNGLNENEKRAIIKALDGKLD